MYNSGDANLYTAFAQNPIRFTDPIGHCPGTCGADITNNLKRMRSELQKEFNKKSNLEKLRIIRAMNDPFSGWDIFELYQVDINRDKQIALSAERSCGTGSCADKVTVDGKCYFAGVVNYYLWGLMNRIADDFWKTVKVSAITIEQEGIDSLLTTGANVTFADGTTYDMAANVLGLSFGLESALSSVKIYRSIRYFYRADNGNLERQAWTRAGWSGDFKDAETTAASVSTCQPCNKKFRGLLTVRVGLAGGRGNNTEEDLLNVYT